MAGLPEKSLERYDLLERIAVGGMAEVFRAKAYGAHGFEKTLAIKRILPELAQDREFEERFITEAKVAVQLSHTNVVQVFDFGRFGGTLFIAMEYVDGLDLAALLKRYRDGGARLPPAAAFHIAIEIMRGLDFAHQRGVVHRDVSPSNVLLSRAGEVKIADFGIALPVGDRRERAQTGSRRRIMGKWRYMSPEQARGETLTPRSDLFSAAVMLHELFTGEKLFPGDDAEKIIDNIQTMTLPRPSQVRPGLPARLDDILARALARNPAERPARAAEMVRSLTELSYESSIVCTALEAAEVVAWALEHGDGPLAPGAEAPGSTAAAAGTGGGGKRGLDDLIRAQLLAGAAVPTESTALTGARKTAVSSDEPDGEAAAAPESTHAATIVRAGIDPLGITMWEVDGDGADEDENGGSGEVDGEDKLSENTVAVSPTAKRGGRNTGPERALGDDDGSGNGSSAESRAASSRTQLVTVTDGGRRRASSRAVPVVVVDSASAATRAGNATAPSEVAVAALAAAATTSPAIAAPPAPPRRRGAIAAAGLIATAAVIAVIAALWLGPGRSSSEPSVTPDNPVAPIAIADAGPAPVPAQAVLRIDTSPGGATAWIDGAAQAQLTPVDVPVSPGAHRVEIELAGHHRHVDERVMVAAGETVRVRATLEPLPPRLLVESDPLGATVSAAGRDLGVTPLDRSDLPAGPLTLTLSKAGFSPITAEVILRVGETATLRRGLHAAERFGTIDLYIQNSWADVYLKGKKVGRAPKKGLRLPVGRHTLRLVNPASGKEKLLAVEVDPDKVSYYQTAL